MGPKSQLDRWILSLHFPNYEKLKCFVETFTSYNQILIFEEQLWMPYKDFYIWYRPVPSREHFLQNLNFKRTKLFWEFSVFYYFISKLVGFGLACAPLRCAHPSFWAHYHVKRGAARPQPIAASLLHIHRPKNINLLFPETKASFRPKLGPPGTHIFPLG